jgi:thiol-disulfide isomerase/thioredoxin
MKIIVTFLAIIICLTLSNCTQKERKDRQFTLLGKISDQDTGFIILQYGILSAFQSDTVKVLNGNFSFKGLIKEPTLGTIKEINKSNRIEFYLEPGVMKLTMHRGNFKDFILTGSKSQEELNSLNKSLESVKNHDSLLIKFVLNNPKSYLSPYYLQDLGYRAKLSLDSLKLIFNRLDFSIQNSMFGRIAKGVIRGIENTTSGNFASDFKATDVNNQIITLSQFKNKNFVLLDFWASWCIPCRESFPHLKRIYTKYHSKGLEIIGVASMDKNRQTWVTAIKEDSTFMWHHIATFFQNGETINKDVTYDYPVGPIPRTILIDKEGKVLGNWVGSSKENEISLDNKLELLFNY